MDYPKVEQTNDESEKESELMELGEVSVETRGGSWGTRWDGGSTYKLP